VSTLSPPAASFCITKQSKTAGVVSPACLRYRAFLRTPFSRFSLPCPEPAFLPYGLPPFFFSLIYRTTPVFIKKIFQKNSSPPGHFVVCLKMSQCPPCGGPFGESSIFCEKPQEGVLA